MAAVSLATASPSRSNEPSRSSKRVARAPIVCSLAGTTPSNLDDVLEMSVFDKSRPTLGPRLANHHVLGRALVMQCFPFGNSLSVKAGSFMLKSTCVATSTPHEALRECVTRAIKVRVAVMRSESGDADIEEVTKAAEKLRDAVHVALDDTSNDGVRETADALLRVAHDLALGELKSGMMVTIGVPATSSPVLPRTDSSSALAGSISSVSGVTSASSFYAPPTPTLGSGTDIPSLSEEELDLCFGFLDMQSSHLVVELLSDGVLQDEQENLLLSLPHSLYQDCRLDFDAMCRTHVLHMAILAIAMPV